MRFRLGHVLDGALNGYDSLQIEAIDIIYRGDSDLCIGLLHNSLDGVAAFADDASNEIIMGQNLQAYFAEKIKNITVNEKRIKYQ